MKSTFARPVLKWAGGKSQLISQIEEYLPNELNPKNMKFAKNHRYIEPFVGGGALFFYLNRFYEFEHVILNDINEDLILTYRVIRDHVEDLIRGLGIMQDFFLSLNQVERKQMYLNTRTLFNENKHDLHVSDADVSHKVAHAANMIFLNKTCFNGLYRVNQKGIFNVPMGRYETPNICDAIALRDASKAFEGVKLTCLDFSVSNKYFYERCTENTFMYIDPPYRPISKTSSFSNYQQEPFDEESHLLLENTVNYITSDKKSKVLVSSSSCMNSSFAETDRYNFAKIKASRSINANEKGRGKIDELLIYNYDIDKGVRI